MIARSVVIAALVQCVVACGSDGTTGPLGASLSIVAGGSATDTVLTELPQALVVEVHNESGVAQSGTVVRFEVLPDPESPLPTWQHAPLFVGPIDSPSYGTFAIDSTDESGRARVLVKLGRLAGQERLAISVPEYGLADTATYEVLPGQVAGVNVSPADTVLLPGAHAQLRAHAVDAFGNERSDPAPTFAAGTANITVGPSGTVEASSAGRAYVIVSAGEVADTAWVSVVPPGAFVAYTNGLPGGALGVITMNNDGSDYKLIASLSTYNFGDGAGPAFSPDHKKVVFFNDQGIGDGTRLYVADVATGALTRATPDEDNPIVREEWGRYSADGQWIYFSGVLSGKSYSLWRVNTDGSAPVQLGGDVGDGNSIEWRGDPSPDGTKLAFVGDGVTIQVMDIASGAIDPDIHVPGQTPRWSPDGTRIAYVSGGYIDGNAIYVMNADGTGNRLVSRPQRSYWEELDWTADGKWLLVRGSQGLEFVSVDDGEYLPLAFTSTFYHPATMR
jgi:hypothetical protein